MLNHSGFCTKNSFRPIAELSVLHFLVPNCTFLLTAGPMLSIKVDVCVLKEKIVYNTWSLSCLVSDSWPFSLGILK